MIYRFFLLAPVLLASAAVAASSATQEQEKYWSTEPDVLLQPLDKKAIRISAETAKKLFDLHGKLGKEWEGAAPDGVKDPLNGAAEPGHSLETHAGVVQFSKKHLIIRISRWSVSQMDKSDRRDMGDLILDRTEEFDEIFDLAMLEATYCLEIKGIKQGMKWEDAEKQSGLKWTASHSMQAALGELYIDEGKKISVFVWSGIVVAVEELAGPEK